MRAFCGLHFPRFDPSKTSTVELAFPEFTRRFISVFSSDCIFSRINDGRTLLVVGPCDDALRAANGMTINLRVILRE